VFVTFEGTEGSGKSVQAKLLVDRLRERGVAVVLTHEPGGTPLGNEVRHLLLGRDDLALTARVEALLMNASRAQLVETLIRPALERGETVVSDRYAGSTLAYQGAGRGLALQELEAVISFATAGLEPDMTLLLDLPVEVGLARKQAQDQRNRFEAEALSFHRRVRDAYLSMAAASPSRWHVVDAYLPVEQLAEQIWTQVEAHMGVVR
jgi:dTMP kinase